jgi:hypothetical protein
MVLERKNREQAEELRMLKENWKSPVPAPRRKMRK